MIIYLINAELFTIKAICLWCTSVHVITFLLFVLIMTTTPIVFGAGEGTETRDYVEAAEGMGSK